MIMTARRMYAAISPPPYLLLAAIALFACAVSSSAAELEHRTYAMVPAEALTRGPVVLVVQYQISGRPITRTYLEADWHACHAAARQVPGADHVVCVDAATWADSGEDTPSAAYTAGSH